MDHPTAADESLAKCPEALRHWEWHYLDHLIHQAAGKPDREAVEGSTPLASPPDGRTYDQASQYGYRTSKVAEFFEKIDLSLKEKIQKSSHRASRVEDYFREFPDLAAHPIVKTALIVAEYRTAKRQGKAPDPWTFAARFPDVPTLLDQLERPKGSATQTRETRGWDGPGPVSREGASFVIPEPTDQGGIYGLAEDIEPMPDPAWMPPLHETQRDPAPLPRSDDDPEEAGLAQEVVKKRSKTWAERKLAERANRFFKDPSYQSLPWFWEWIAIVWQTKRSSWTNRQREMMATALWFDLGLIMGVTVVASLVGLGIRAWRMPAEAPPEVPVVVVPHVEKEAVEGYARIMAEASKEIEAHRIDRAGELLDKVAPALRGWEWAYLKQSGHTRSDEIPTKGPTADVAVSGNGGRLAACGRFDEPTGRHEGETRQAGYVSLWDVVDGQFRERPGFSRSSPFLRVVLSADGRLVAAVSESGVTAWEVEGGKELFHLARPGDPIVSLAFDMGGTRLATAERNGLVTVYGVPDGGLLHQLGEMGEGGTKRVTFSPDGHRIAADGGGRLELWDAADGRSILRRKQPRRLVSGSVVFRPDGKQIAAEDEEGRVRTWNAEDGKELAGFGLLGEGADLLAFSPDGKRLAGAIAQTLYGGHLGFREREGGRPLRRRDGQASHPSRVLWPDLGRHLQSR